IREQHGDIARYRFAGRDTYLVTGADAAKRVLQDNAANYTKEHASYKMLRRLFGNGLITSEGSFWLRQRRLAQPAFHRQRLHAWGDVMVRAARELVDRSWSPRIASRAPFDVHDDMMRVTLRIVGEALLS